MENNTEIEIYRKEAQIAKKNFKAAIIIFATWFFIGIFVDMIVALKNGNILYMFRGGLYWIGYGNAILGFVLMMIFVILQLRPTRHITLVLTNKRVYISFSKKLLFKRTFTWDEVHNLSKIVSYEYVKVTRKKRSIAQLSLKTAGSHLNFIADDEFYGKFVDAVNNAC